MTIILQPTIPATLAKEARQTSRTPTATAAGGTKGTTCRDVPNTATSTRARWEPPGKIAATAGWTSRPQLLPSPRVRLSLPRPPNRSCARGALLTSRTPSATAAIGTNHRTSRDAPTTATTTRASWESPTITAATARCPLPRPKPPLTLATTSSRATAFARQATVRTPSGSGSTSTFMRVRRLSKSAHRRVRLNTPMIRCSGE
mmetsp:Transcript_4880/g.11025  ORF Transcript_4880/g.11025 Transcript_4880/m.11025 type:complete len:203 (-) Transcript_4880:156-764(-)